MAKPTLVIIAGSSTLTAVLCRPGPLESEIVALERQPLGTELKRDLAALIRACEARGASLSSRPIVCLGMEQGLFHDFDLPPSSRRMAAKTVPLLLDGELPCDIGDFAQKTVFTPLNPKKGWHALTTLIPEKTIQDWKETLGALGAFEAAFCIEPWPVIGGLSSLKKSSLLLCACGGRVAVCALEKGGKPLRIQQLIGMTENDGKGAEDICRQCRMLLAGLDFRPEQLLLYGPGALAGLKTALESEFAMPAKIVGDDIPLGKFHSRLGENDETRLVARFLSRMAFLRHWTIPVFPARIRKAQKNHGWLRFWLPVAGVAILLMTAGISFLLDSLNRQDQALKLREQMRKQLAAAMPDAPGNASLGRLKSILGSRIATLEASSRDESPKEVLRMLEDIHKAAPASLNIDLRRMGIDEKHLRLAGSAANFDEVNSLKEQLGNIEGIAESRIVNAANRADRAGGRGQVEFEIDLARTGKDK